MIADYAEKQLRPKTISRYKSMMPRINAAIGHIRLDRLQPHHLLTFYDNLEEAGIREDVTYTCLLDFKELLSERGITKAAFAPIAGIGLSVLNSISQGKNVSKISAKKIAVALDMPLPSLLIPVTWMKQKRRSCSISRALVGSRRPMAGLRPAGRKFWPN